LTAPKPSVKRKLGRGLLFASPPCRFEQIGAGAMHDRFTSPRLRQA
jgi:hypothetical protein